MEEQERCLPSPACPTMVEPSLSEELSRDGVRERERERVREKEEDVEGRPSELELPPARLSRPLLSCSSHGSEAVESVRRPKSRVLDAMRFSVSLPVCVKDLVEETEGVSDGAGEAARGKCCTNSYPPSGSQGGSTLS